MCPKRILVKTLKDFWRIKYRTIAIILTIAVSVTIYIGTHTALRSINGTCARLYRQLHLCDLQVNFVPATEDELPKLAAAPQPAPGVPGIPGRTTVAAAQAMKGVGRLEKRLILPGSIETKNDELIATLLIVLDEEKEPDVNRLKIMKGSYFKEESHGSTFKEEEHGSTSKEEEHSCADRGSVLLDYTFARERGYDVGDTITLGVQGFFSEFKIIGLAVNAEHLITSANPDFYMPIKNSLGIAYIPMKTIKDLFGYRIYNNYSLTLAKGADLPATRRAFENLLMENNIELDSVLLRDDLFSVKVLKRDMRSFFMVLPAIVGVFILVSFLILFFSLSRMIQQDRSQLGTLLALGFSPSQLFSAYIIGGTILGLIGYLIGCAASNSLADLVVKSYMSGTGLPLMFRYYSGKSFLIALLFSLGAPTIAAALSLMQIRGMNVAEMLGRTIEKPWHFASPGTSDIKTKIKIADTAAFGAIISRGNHLFGKLFKNLFGNLLRNLFERGNIFRRGNISKRGSIFKIGMRNLWRRKAFFLLSALSIVLGIALAESLIIADVSIYRTIDDFFKLEKWDLFIPFTGLVERQRVEKLKEIEGISKISPYKKELVNLQLGNEKKPYQIAGVSKENSLIRPDIVEGRSFSSDEAQEIVLNIEMKDLYGLKIGDSIDVWPGNRKKARLKLVGVMNNFIANQGFVPIGVAQDMSTRKDRYTGVFLALNAPFEKIRSKIQKLDFTGYVVRKDEAQNTFHDNMKKISTFLYTYSLMSLFLSICIIFVNLYLNAVYRKGEYAILLANGFGQREIGCMIAYEILAITLIVTAAAIPLSIVISKYFCYKIARTAVMIHLQIRPVDYLKVFIPMIFLMAGVGWYCTRYASTIDITSTIRNRINE